MADKRVYTEHKDAEGNKIYSDDILKISGQHVGEIFQQRGRWMVAVETLRFMFPITILPLDVAVSVYHAVRKGGKCND